MENSDRWIQFLLQDTNELSRLYQNLFKASMDITGLPVAGVARIRHETHLRIEALADRVGIGYRASQEFPQEELLDSLVIEKRDGLVIPDIPSSRYASHPSALRFNIGSYIATPVILGNGQIYGVFSLVDKRPHPLGKAELLRLGLLGRWLGYEVERRRLERELKNKSHRLATISQELQMASSQLEQASIRDPLTDLFNSRHFNKILHVEASRAQRHGYPLTLLMMYPDGLHRFLERGGPQVANMLISGVAVLLRRHLRTIDTASRYGDDLFAILLPQTDVAGAVTVADRIRSAIGGHRFPVQGAQQPGVVLTASLGIGVLIPNEDEPGLGMLSRARRALEQARTAGGDRVLVAQ